MERRCWWKVTTREKGEVIKGRALKKIYRKKKKKKKKKYTQRKNVTQQIDRPFPSQAKQALVKKRGGVQAR